MELFVDICWRVRHIRCCWEVFNKRTLNTFYPFRLFRKIAKSYC